MGLIANAWNPEPRASVSWTPLDDRWYAANLGFDAESGEAVALSADSILRCGTVLAAVRFLADAFAMCPANTLKRTERGVTEDPGHYSHVLLRDPNAWQTDYDWQHMTMVRCALWGNAYNEIMPTRESWAGQLWPMDSDRVDIVDQMADGQMIYRYRDPAGPERRLTQNRVLHFHGISTDGVGGLKMYTLIRNVVSIALAAEQHTAAFLRKGARLSGLVVPQTPLEKADRETLRATLNKDLGGTKNTGAWGVLPFGVEVKTNIASNNRESQLVELSDQMIGAILRFLGVPGVVAGYADKTATYASAKEFFESGGIKHCVLPWVTNFEARASKTLLERGDGRQIKYNLGVLLRSSTKDTYEALLKAIGRPFMTGNEGRRIIDLNPIDGDPTMDVCVLPKNTGPDQEPQGGEDVGDPPARPRPIPTPTDDGEEARHARGWQFAVDAAARVVRRELAALRDRAPLAAKDPEGWREWVTAYYDRHAEHVAEALHIDPAAAQGYASAQRDSLLTAGLAQCETWHETIPYRLASLAYGD